VNDDAKFPAVRDLANIYVSHADLETAWEEIKRDWERHLKQHGVKLPRKGTARWYQLTILKRHQGQAVSKTDISEWIAKETGQQATDQQVRHLKTQNGWYVLNRGDEHEGVKVPDKHHVLITTKQPYPKSNLARRTAVKSGDWEIIKQTYSHRCASCGAKEGDPSPYDPRREVKLQQGHMDPDKGLKPGNIIPQCAWCNQTARGDFVFDAQGRPRAIASVRPVKRASKKVQAEVKAWLRAQDEEPDAPSSPAKPRGSARDAPK